MVHMWTIHITCTLLMVVLNGKGNVTETCTRNEIMSIKRLHVTALPLPSLLPHFDTSLTFKHHVRSIQ